MGEWQPISTAPLDGTPVLLFTTCRGIVEAWFDGGGWTEETPEHPAEYDGAVWVCADDTFQIEVEELSSDPAEWHHNTATHWMHRPDPPTERERDR